jgi:cytochrome c oxidase subunit IV
MHVHAKSFYVLVFVALLSLTALTTAVAYVDLGYLNTVAALVIAVCKASLVVLFFMHLRDQVGMTRVVLLAALLWLAVLIGITASDIFTRGWSTFSSGWHESQTLSAPRSPSATRTSSHG